MTQLINHCSNVLPERHFNDKEQKVTLWDATGTQLDFSGVVSGPFGVWLEVRLACLRTSLISMRRRDGWIFREKLSQSQKPKHRTDGQSDTFSHAYQCTDSALVIKRKKDDVKTFGPKQQRREWGSERERESGKWWNYVMWELAVQARVLIVNYNENRK